MFTKYRLLIVALSITVLMASCAKEGPTGPTGPAGPIFYGDIQGHVDLYDQYGSLVTTNLGNVELLLNIVGDTVIHAQSTGTYSYLSIPTGNYILYASDTPGYGGTQLTFQFVSGILNKDVKLSAIPTFSISALAATENAGAANDSLTITVPADARPRNCIIFVNSIPAVSNLTTNYLLAYVKTIPANQANVALLIPAQDLYNVGIASGSKAYYAAYSYVISDASVYEDVASGKKVYNAVGLSPVVDSAIVP